jgi:hypothetical protein
MTEATAHQSSAGHTSHEGGHGGTPAAWTTVVIITLAFAVGTVGLIIGNWVVFWIGVGLVPVGGIVGKVMQMMGMGARPRA